MELIVGTALAGVAIFFVVRPLWDRRRVGGRAAGAGHLEGLRAERSDLYRVLRELDLEQEMGRISAEDYRSQRREHLVRAANLLQEIDAHSPEMRGSAVELSERCPTCGSPRRAEDRYCPRCGVLFERPA